MEIQSNIQSGSLGEMTSQTGGKVATLAIVGRPNVGKSSLFNYLIGERRALVKNQPGVTRDLIMEDADLWGHNFNLVDTGGLTEADDIISRNIREQVVEYLESTDALILMMDGRAGLCPEDREVLRIVKETGRPFLLVCNKIDKVADLDVAGAEFYEFGQEVITCSVERRLGLEPLLQWIHQQTESVEQKVTYGFPISIVGKPNVGKSTLCNHLVGENRHLVSEIAGTTVDPIDTLVEVGERHYLFTDTAGLRRAAKRTDGLEILSSFKTSGAIKRSDLVLLLVDGVEGPTEQDAKIVQEVIEANKTVLLVINKSDLGVLEMEAFRSTTRQKISDVFHFFPDIPISFISAKTGKGVEKLFAQIEELRSKLHTRIPTKALNDFFFRAIRGAPAPVFGTKNVKFYYLTQTQQVPPSFIAFANHPDGVDPSYRRFITKQMKKQWDLHGIPLRLFVMKSRSH